MARFSVARFPVTAAFPGAVILSAPTKAHTMNEIKKDLSNWKFWAAVGIVALVVVFTYNTFAAPWLSKKTGKDLSA